VGHEDECDEAQPNRGRVDVSAVAADRAAAFELTHVVAD
jgi:hypothetical protein